MSETTFELAFDGEAVRDGEIDVTDLAPALLAFGQLARAAGRVVYGDDATAAVRVRATREGSFEVDLSLAVEVAKAAKATWQWWKTDDVQAAVQLAGLLGFTGTGTASVVAAVRWLRGRRARRSPPVAQAPATIVTPDGDSLELDDAVARMIVDNPVRAALEKAFSEPFENEGIDSIRVGPADAPTLTVKREEAVWFEAPVAEDDDLYVSQYTRPFSIVDLSFDENRKWRLSDGRGKPKRITIQDDDFVARVNRNVERFAKGDILICEVVETSRRTASGFKSDFEITRIVEHRPAPVLPELPLLEKPPEELPVRGRAQLPPPENG